MARPQDHVPEHLVVLVSGELPGQRVNGKVISNKKNPKGKAFIYKGPCK